MRRNLLLALLAAACVAGILIYGLAVGYPGVLHPSGLIALAERRVIIVTFLLSGIVIIPVFFFLFYFALKYRAGTPAAEAVHEPNWDHDNWRAEALWWFVPAVIILLLSMIAWQSSHALDPYQRIQSDVPPVTVEVVALDWKWLFIYPQLGIASLNQLELPSGTPVHFILTADAPMNSFWVPRLSGQIMVMPGMSTELNILASSTGRFDGQSANISGDGFSGMTFTTTVVAPKEFDAWVANVRKGSDPLTQDGYAQLRKPSQYVTPATYSSVAGNLYDSIMMQYMAPMATSSMPSDMQGMPMDSMSM